MKIVKTLFANFYTSLFTVFWLVLSLGQLQRIQLPNNIAFYAHDLIVTLFVLVFLWQFRNKLKIDFEKYKLELTFIGIMLFSMLIGFFEGRVDFKSLLYLARLVDYSIFVFALNKVKIKYPPYLGFIFSGSVIALWGLWQYFVMPDVRFLNIFGWDNHYYRLISTIFDPAFTGIILVITLGLWQKLVKKVNKNIIFIFQLLLTIAIAATFSRASYLAFSWLTVHQFFSSKNKRKWLLLGIIFLITITKLPKPGGEGVNLARTSTIEARSENVRENLITLEGPQWIWGRGLFNDDAQKESYTNQHAQLPDNLFVLVINATGLVGFVYFLRILVKWLYFYSQKDSLWTVLLIVTIAHSMFNNTMLQPFVFLSLWGSRSNT